jgi:hypothetical protein
MGNNNTTKTEGSCETKKLPSREEIEELKEKLALQNTWGKASIRSSYCPAMVE